MLQNSVAVFRRLGNHKSLSVDFVGQNFYERKYRIFQSQNCIYTEGIALQKSAHILEL